MKLIDAKKSLLNIVDKQKVSNGYIFYSQDEKLSNDAAIYFAKCICCSGELVPCGVCSNCNKIDKNIHPDIIYIEKHANKASISVDVIREIISTVNIKPNEANSKVYIINSAQTLTVSAQNALLKVLEEPPQSIHFILCATNEGAMLQTIKSRCQKLTISEQREKNNESTFVKNYIDALLDSNKYNFIILANKLGKDRAKNISQLEQLLDYLSEILAVKNKVKQDEKKLAIANKLTNKAISRLIENTWELINKLLKNCNVALVTTVYFISCWEEIH